jgi:HD-like signal output (HDOD) protein
MAGMNDILTIDRLPAMPAALARVIPLLLDPTAEWDALERVMRRDEALTAAVLRLANSARFGAPGRHFDLRRAIQRLGRDELRRCVLEQQVSSVVSGDNEAFGLQRGAMWRSALGGAIAAEELARRHAPQETSLAFVCGLLRDIGKLALNVKYGAGYIAMISTHASEGRSFIEAERVALGFDHAQVGAALARRWSLPERVAGSIETHHLPPPPGPGNDVLFDIVHAADTIGRWAGLGVGVDGMEYRLAEHVRQGLTLDRPSAEREIAVVWEKLREAEESLGEVGTQGAAA